MCSVHMHTYADAHEHRHACTHIITYVQLHYMFQGRLRLESLDLEFSRQQIFRTGPIAHIEFTQHTAALKRIRVLQNKALRIPYM